MADNARRTWPLAGYFDDPEAEPDDEAPEELPLAPLPPEDAEALQSAPFASLPLMQVPVFAGLRRAEERGEGVAGEAGEADVVEALLLARLPDGVVLFADAVVSAIDGLIEEDVVLPE